MLHQNYAIGGVNGVFVIVDEDGNVSFFDGSQKKVTGTAKLDGRVVAPVNVACSVTGTNEGCVIVDGAGSIWIGSARGGHFGSPIGKVS